jgi:hypothetical protein
MVRKYVLRNRNLAVWLGAATLMGESCSGGSTALNGTAWLLQAIASFL